MSNHIKHTLVLGIDPPCPCTLIKHYGDMLIPTTIFTYLKEDLGAFHRRGDYGGRNGGEEARRGKLGGCECRVSTVWRESPNQLLGSIVCLTGRAGGGGDQRSQTIDIAQRESTQNESANMGVTPNKGGTTPRYSPVGPSLANVFFMTSTPPVYVPGGAVCNLVLVKSNGWPRNADAPSERASCLL